MAGLTQLEVQRYAELDKSPVLYLGSNPLLAAIAIIDVGIEEKEGQEKPLEKLQRIKEWLLLEVEKQLRAA